MRVEQPLPTFGPLLVIGGTRSGKSRIATELAVTAANGGTVLFIATADPHAGDRSLIERIERHRSARPANWRTVEAPINLPEALTSSPVAPAAAAVLVDCLTLWLSNLLLSAGDPDAPSFKRTATNLALRRTQDLLRALDGADVPVVIVTDEVGSGVAPATRLGNVFADLQGELNQEVASKCRAVFHVVAGIPTRIK